MVLITSFRSYPSIYVWEQFAPAHLFNTCDVGIFYYASAFRRRRHYVFRVVCRSEAWNNLFSPVHGSVGPSDQPWLFYGMSVRPSVWRGFWAFAGEHIGGMVWNFACWCILGTFRTDYIMVMVCWFSSFWHHFDLVKWVKFGVSMHFPENTWSEWSVSWPPSELFVVTV